MKARRSVARDSGLTLVELVIVTVLLGMVAAVISVAFVTILRTTPATQHRIDDARSTRGLQTWITRDMASAPPAIINVASDLDPGGYDFSTPTASALVDTCSASGQNLMHMTWVDASNSNSFHANYTIDNGVIYRTTCSTASPTGSPQRLTGDVSATKCPSSPFNGTSYVKPIFFDHDGDSLTAEIVASVDICVLSIEADTGLDAGGDVQEILLSVSSRNYAGVP